MDKIIDIKEILKKAESEEKTAIRTTVQKVTNPILTKLAKFKNENLSKKFDINDLLK